MKQLLFTVFFCISSLCYAQNTIRQYYAEPTESDTFLLRIKNGYDYEVNNPLCNIVKFKRISEKEMLLMGKSQDYRLTADLPFNLKWRKVKTDNFYGFELQGLYVTSTTSTKVKVSIEDANQKKILDREYGIVPIDIYVEYEGADQKKHTTNLNDQSFEQEIDSQKEIRFIVRTKDEQTLPILQIRFQRTDCMDCNPPANIGGTLNANMREFLAKGKILGESNRFWFDKRNRIYICVHYRIGKEEVKKYVTLTKTWPFMGRTTDNQ